MRDRTDPTEALVLYMHWLRRRLPGWHVLAECPEGRMGWLDIGPTDGSVHGRTFYFPCGGERQAMVDAHIWLMDLHRQGKLPKHTW